MAANQVAGIFKTAVQSIMGRQNGHGTYIKCDNQAQHLLSLFILTAHGDQHTNMAVVGYDSWHHGFLYSYLL